jgi:hypothetical protein
MLKKQREFKHISAVFKGLLWNNIGRIRHAPGRP